VYIVGENKMKEKRYQMEETRNYVEKAYSPKGELESLFFEDSDDYQLKFREKNGK
jgi:hypothetical protein